MLCGCRRPSPGPSMPDLENLLRISHASLPLPFLTAPSPWPPSCAGAGARGGACGDGMPQGTLSTAFCLVLGMFCASLTPLPPPGAPLALAQAHAEVDAVMSDRETPSLADYSALKYVMRCLNESMRLYPHPPVLLRRALVEDKLPGEAPAAGLLVTYLPKVSGGLLCVWVLGEEVRPGEIGGPCLSRAPGAPKCLLG
jgi:hypothetical protein